jgi:hypothetical protein
MFADSQQYDFYVTVKQLSQKKQLLVAAVSLTSLRNVQCRQNRPFYVIYSGDPNIGKTLRKVGSCQRSLLLYPSNNAHRYESTYQGKYHPATGYEIPEGECRYSSTLSLTSVLGRFGWSTPRPGLFSHRNDPIRMIQEAGWDPGPAWTGAENLASNGIRSTDRPPRSESLYRLCCPGPLFP